MQRINKFNKPKYKNKKFKFKYRPRYIRRRYQIRKAFYLNFSKFYTKPVLFISSSGMPVNFIKKKLKQHWEKRLLQFLIVRLKYRKHNQRTDYLRKKHAWQPLPIFGLLYNERVEYIKANFGSFPESLYLKALKLISKRFPHKYFRMPAKPKHPRRKTKITKIKYITITASKHNIFINVLTHLNKNLLSYSVGQFGKKKNLPNVEKVIYRIIFFFKKIDQLKSYVIVKVNANWLEYRIKRVCKILSRTYNLQILTLIDYTNFAHNGIRKRKQKRL